MLHILWFSTLSLKCCSEACPQCITPFIKTCNYKNLKEEFFVIVLNLEADITDPVKCGSNAMGELPPAFHLTSLTERLKLLCIPCGSDTLGSHSCLADVAGCCIPHEVPPHQSLLPSDTPYLQSCAWIKKQSILQHYLCNSNTSSNPMDLMVGSFPQRWKLISLSLSFIV